MLAATIGVAIVSTLLIWAFSLFIEPLEAQFGWSRAEVALASSLALLASGLASPFVGKWADRYGPRSVIVVGSLLSTVALLLLSTTSALWEWYLFYSLTGASLALAYLIPFQALASRWFARRRGMALGMLAVGVSLGGFVGVPVFGVLIDAIGWENTFRVGAVLIAAYLLPVALFAVRNDPREVGLLPDGAIDSHGLVARPALLGLTLRAALATPVFWAVTLGIAAFSYASFGLLAHAVPLFESLGTSGATATAMVSLTAGGGIFARVAIAALVDRGGRFEYAGVAISAGGLGGAAILLGDSGLVALVLFVLFWGVGQSGPGFMEPLAVSRIFGVAHFGTILGFVQVIRIGIMVTAPAVTGVIFDVTGAYTLALTMFVAVFALSVALFFVALRLRHPSLVPVSSDSAPR